MSNILYLSSFFPKEHRDYFTKNSKGAISNANDSLQASVLQGFEKHGCKVSILNVPNIGSFPKRFKKLKSLSCDFKISADIQGYNIGFINIPILKHVFIEKMLKNYCQKNIEIIRKVDYVFVYDLYAPFLNILKELKILNKNCKIVVMIPDIIGYTNSKVGIIHRRLNENNLNSLIQANRSIDGFVYLTEKMSEALPSQLRLKPYLVIEGILNEENLIYEKKNSVGNKYIFYSGSLDLRHGILNLIESYINADIGKEVELHICGDGDGKEVMLRKIEGISTIKYHGQMSREIVIRKQADAFLLINPRSSKGEFTKYSFPSKIMEYFLSGTPSFMYKLEGIPREYFEYCLSLDDESNLALTDFLKNLLKLSDSDLFELGSKARQFVLEQKNPSIQVSKILEFFKYLEV